MANLLTNAEVREHILTALGDDALDRITNSAQQAIERACGALASATPPAYDQITEENYRTDGLPMFKLVYYPASVVAVRTVDSLGVSTTLVAGDANDYVVDGQLLRRTPTGLWGAHTSVDYVPRTDQDLRKGALLKLIELDLNAQPGQKFTGAATWQESYADYETERQRLLWDLCPPEVFA